jgi:IPT/TIG domain
VFVAVHNTLCALFPEKSSENFTYPNQQLVQWRLTTALSINSFMQNKRCCMKKSLLKTILIQTGFLLVFASCKKKNFNEENTNPGGAAAVQVTNLVPNAAQYGSTVTIQGKNFDTINSVLAVKINNTALNYTLVNDSTITVTIPQGLGSGQVVVTKSAQVSTGPNFEYLYTGNVSTFSGNGNTSPITGNALQVGYGQPFGLTIDAQGNLYVTDNLAGSVTGQLVDNIRKITPAGAVFVFAQDLQLAKSFGDIVLDNNNLFYTSISNHFIASYNLTSGVYGFQAGIGQAFYQDGIPTQAAFNRPFFIAKNSSNEIFISDANNYCIRKLIIGQSVSTYAGINIAGDVNANGTNARFLSPAGLYMDVNNDLYVCDADAAKIKKISPARDVTTVAGSTPGYVNGPIALAKFTQPVSITKDDSGNIIVTDANNTVRCITASGIVYTLAGVDSFDAGSFADGIGSAARFKIPIKIVFAGNKTFYIADVNNRRIRKMVLQ